MNRSHPADSTQLKKSPIFEAGRQILMKDKFLPVPSKKRNVIFACK